MNTFIRRILLLAFLSILASQLEASPLGTAFTYQGRLTVGGNAANGSYDLRFVLYTAETGGSQVGSILTNISVPVVSGLFSAALDFGPGIFNGAAGWLEIAVRPSGGGNFTTMDPRQPLPPVPNALYAHQAANAVLLNGQSAAAYAPASGSPAYVAKAGDTMTGPLIVPANGLEAGANQLRLSAGNVGVGTGSPSQKLDVAGNIHYSGQLTRLDVADNWEATVRAADFRLGHSLRHGTTPGRALVDFTDKLCVNFAADWASTCVYGGVVLDPDGINGGTLSPGLIFGQNSGEGIASKRTAGGNQHGLDFYQNFQPRLSIAAGGNVGIGTTAPSEKLEVAGAIASTGTGATPSIRLKNTAAGEWRITSYSDHALRFWNAEGMGGGGNRLTIDKDGCIGINTVVPTAGLHVEALDGRGGGWTAVYGNGSYGVIGKGFFNGVMGKGTAYDFYADGGGIDYGSSSSIRWKRDIEPIPDPLGKLAQLRGVYFNWDQEHGGRHDIGMVAEEVGAVLPEIVAYEANGVDANGMDYAKLTPLLVEAVKVLHEDVERGKRKSESRMERLEAENAVLRETVLELKNLVEALVAEVNGGTP